MQIKSNEIGGMDVYNFLHMVKSLSNGEEENNACLGEDIDDLLEEEDVDFGMSPQHNSGFDAVFEENCEVLNGSTSNGWDANAAETKDGGSESARENSWSSRMWKADAVQEDAKSNAWNANLDQTKEKSNDWSAWGRNKSREQDGGSEKALGDSWRSRKSDVIQENFSKSSAWETNKEQTKTQSNDWSAWGGNKSSTQDGGSERVLEESWSQKLKSDVIQDDFPKSSAWDANKKQAKTQSNDWSSRREHNSEIQYVGSERAQDDSWSSLMRKTDNIQEDSSRSNAWTTNTDETKSKSSDWSNLGRNKSEIQDGSQKSSAWDVKTDQRKPCSNDRSAWARNKSEVQDGWSERAQEDSWSSQKSSPWEVNTDSTKTRSNDWLTWGSSKDKIQDAGLERANEDSWSSGMRKAEPKVGADVMQEDSNAWEHNSDNVKVGNSSWGKPKSPEDQPWNSQNESNQAASSHGWESQIASANSDSDRSFQWGKRGRESFKKNRFEGSQGWGSNAGDRKNKSRPARAPGQRLDIYTSEEQDVLKDIEPVMQSIRRIMQQEG